MFLEVFENCGFEPENENQEDNRGQADPRPEYFQYRDEGCKRAESCLDCPFTRCFYDRPGTRQRQRVNRGRDEDIKALRQSGKTVKQLSRYFKVSQRTIERILYGRPSRAKLPEKREGDKEDA
jgi:hypothetical protein